MSKKLITFFCISLIFAITVSLFGASAAVTGDKNVYNSTSILEALEDDDWDFVTMQQVSQNSGQYNTFFPYLTNLSDYVAEHEPNATQVFHMTWAYEKGSSHSGFANYDRDQQKMYEAIVDASTHAAEEVGIDIILPSGVAWQKARATSIGDHLCRDGYHGNEKGQYLAGAVWYEMLSGHCILDNSYVPHNSSGTPIITLSDLEILKQCAHEAVEEYRTAPVTPLSELKVLAIGNSFSDDASTYISQMAMADGVAFTLGKLYIGGCSLQTHWNNARNNSKSYTYTKFNLAANNDPTVYYFSDLENNGGIDYTVYTQVDQNPMTRLLWLAPSGVDQSISFRIPEISAGFYEVSIASRDYTTRGKYSIKLGNATVGSVNFAGSGNNLHTIGTVIVSDSGETSLELTVTGQNNSSYNAFLNYIVLTPKTEYVNTYETGDGMLWGVDDTDVETFKASFDAASHITVQVQNGDAEVTSGNIGTGMTVNILKDGVKLESYTIIVYGDLSGDGRINSTDLQACKRHILGKGALSDAKLIAANVNRSEDGNSNASDLLLIKGHILGLSTIEQK